MEAAAVIALCLPLPGSPAAKNAPSDPEAVLQTAERLGAFPAVYQNLRAMGVPLPDEWQQRFRDNFVHNLALRQEESRLVARLMRAGLDCRAIKGVRLVELLYPDLSWRAVADIDLLAPRAQVEAAYSELKAAGLRDVAQPWNPQSLARQVAQPAHAFAELVLRSPQGLIVELHWDWPGDALPPASPADDSDTYLLYLARHAGKHFWCSLQNLTDLELYLRKFSDRIDWDRFWRLARRTGWARLAAASFHLCAMLFGRPLRLGEQRAAARSGEALARRAATLLVADSKPWWWRHKPLRLLRVYTWPQRISRCWLWLAPPPWHWNHPGSFSSKDVWLRRYRLLFWQGLACFTPWPAWRRRLERAAEASTGDWLLLAGAFGTLSLVRIGLALIPYHRLQRWATTLGKPPSVPLDRDAVLRAAKFVDFAAGHHPVPMRCLARSLALSRLLARRGVPTEIKMGVRTENGNLDGHAWTEWRGEPINDPHQRVCHFVELASPRRS